MIFWVNVINYGILVFFIFSAIIYSLILFISLPDIFRYFYRTKETNIYALLKPTELPPVTLITPFYNEGPFLIQNVLSALKSDYKNLYVMLVNDGSTDNSLELIVSYFEMREEPLVYSEKIKTAKLKALYVSKKYPNLMLLDKEHSNVGDTLNAGLNLCFTPYFITFDADSILHKTAVSEMVYELLSNPNTIGVGGGVYILNACRVEDGQVIQSRMPRGIVLGMQGCEYLRSHVFNRTGWNNFGATMSYSGTASLYNLASVLEVNGYDTDNFAQDTEIVMRLHHHMRLKKVPYQIRFTPSATIWTDVPDSIKSFGIQRERWQRGILKSVLNYPTMFLNPRYKIQGLFAYPVYVLLEAVAPLVEFTAYFTVTFAFFMGFLDYGSAVLYILLAWGFLAYLTIANMFINYLTFNRYYRINDILWACLLAFIEMLGFRQFLTGVKVWGTVHYFINRLRGKAV